MTGSAPFQISIETQDYANSSHGGTCCNCAELLPFRPNTDRGFPGRGTRLAGLPYATGQSLLHVSVRPLCGPYEHRGVQVCSEGCAIQILAWIEALPDNAMLPLCPAHSA